MLGLGRFISWSVLELALNCPELPLPVKGNHHCGGLVHVGKGKVDAASLPRSWVWA